MYERRELRTDLVLRILGRLSAARTGSARRRAREWEKAERNRREGEQIARQRNELRQRQKLENQAQARRDLEAYEPWGRAGGGAPNARGIRFTDIRAKGIYPEDELKGVQLHDGVRYFGSSPVRRRRMRQTPLRLREDPQCYYAENLRKSVDNDIRYRQTPEQQRCYKEVLDDMVKAKQKAMDEEMRRNLEFEQKMHQMEEPWGRPGPGGTSWRNPRNIGQNFAKSMGWTGNEILNNMEKDRRRLSSLTLPQVKRDDDYYDDYLPGKENVHFELPDIARDKTDNLHKQLEEYERQRNELMKDHEKRRKEMKPISVSAGKGMRSPKKKMTKRMPYRDEVQLSYPEDLYEKLPKQNYGSGSVDMRRSEGKTPTPEDVILRTTGGVELVPLLARRRRVGARTLPSSDVTRPPEQPCQWREMIDAEHLAILKHQMKAKCLQKEESRQTSAESVRRHHETWASLWGRPGHGAPQQRGRYARSNLAALLYAKPLEHLKYDQYV